MGAHPVHLQIWVHLLRRAYTGYMVCVCVRVCVCVFTHIRVCMCVPVDMCVYMCVFVHHTLIFSPLFEKYAQYKVIRESTK